MIDKACKVAENSQFSRARVGAVIANKHKILSSGCNELRGFNIHSSKKKWENSLHAEQAAILKLLKQNKQRELVGSVIYVSRIKKDGSMGLAKPCSFCDALIRAVGIKKVVYSTETSVETYKVI